MSVSIGAKGPVTHHIIHLELISPQGSVREEHTQNVLAEGGRCKITIPLAINADLGPWQITATDVASGKTTSHAFTVVK